VSYVRLNEIVNGRRAVTPDTALRFARALGTSPEFWLNGQLHVDLWDVLHSNSKEINEIQPLESAAR
jgi:addiction module HigA family antidote